MKWVLNASDVMPDDRQIVGGKAYALALLAQSGYPTPETLCVTSRAYRAFVGRTGLGERVMLELHRKDFNDMRWEEIWDCATRIRNMFLRTPLPPVLATGLKKEIETRFKNKAVAVRSSSPEEDGRRSSFAGLHQSYLNIRGPDAILEHIRKVWASLWSDAALLYRREIGLDVEKSAMAVVIQEILIGTASGVIFTQNPNDPAQGVIESVYGLNQGLVEGSVEPDRWILDRRGKTILAHTPAVRQQWVIPHENGVRLASLPADLSGRPPLNANEVLRLYALARQVENSFKSPQDVEWTLNKKKFSILQSRPITTLTTAASDDQRGWYLSLHRSFENLKSLRQKIETERIPAMISVAETLGEQDLTRLSDSKLAAEIKNRREINQQWVNIYWEEFIPFAHSIRLFGQLYNDVMHPEDPYAFADLLIRTDMASMERNRALTELAELIRNDRRLAAQLKKRKYEQASPVFFEKIETFIRKFGDLSCTVTGGTQCVEGAEPLFDILLEIAAHPPQSAEQRKLKNTESLQKKFLESFTGRERDQAVELLDLARRGYQLRDDDNIYLGRIEAQLLRAVQEAKTRIDKRPRGMKKSAVSTELIDTLADLDYRPQTPNPYRVGQDMNFKIQARQLVGQPAGPGLAIGVAKVVQQHTDLADFKYGEVLVCDAVDPNMTFVVPLASAIVERRGGMLIHGAIIAREYGLPCVTGIADATTLIKPGDKITVDGYLGIVTLGSGEI